MKTSHQLQKSKSKCALNRKELCFKEISRWGKNKCDYGSMTCVTREKQDDNGSSDNGCVMLCDTSQRCLAIENERQLILTFSLFLPVSVTVILGTEYTFMYMYTV